MKTNRFLYHTAPKALTQNTITGKSYRFTVLTDCLIRMEYDQDGIFEDRASQSVFFRDFPENNFSVYRENQILIIETEKLIVTYLENAPFSAETLSISLKDEPASTWCFGDDFEHLGGTVSTLDLINGSLPLGIGICSRNGFSVIDDSNTVLLDEEGWIAVRRPDAKDFYFFGYGYQYREAIKDFYRLTGVPPMLPRYALGNWWSRYHKYTQEEYQNLILSFEEKNIPFSVAVIDMDWHITQIPADKKDEDKRFSTGWTGYTWNRELFPDYKAFLRFLKDHHLHTSLNLHPAEGIGPHEEMYAEMALAAGIDPKTENRVPLDILSPSFMEKYFDVLHHPYEDDGVDFWWMDWQQGDNFWWIHEPNTEGKMADEREAVSPLWLLNHLHIKDISRSGKRPMFFSRYAGPGSHRYPVGFSGDTFITWDSLEFQPYFTATASNIGYGWWSHDIGGHLCGYCDDELITRWVQLGVFSPINRLHSTVNDFIKKEPWCFPERIEKILSDSLRLRHKLFPYIYTMAYRHHTELSPLVQPMYYDYPKCDGAYRADNQFMFGSELLVAPITKPCDATSTLSSAEVWLPKGDWFDFSNGTHYHAAKHRTLTVHRTLEETPVFAKAGAIIPMQNDLLLGENKDMSVVIFPGQDGSFTLYEDAGDGMEYQNGDYAKTNLSLRWGNVAEFCIAAPEGNATCIPEERTWQLIFRGFAKETICSAFVNEEKTNADLVYQAETHSWVLTITAPKSATVKVQLEKASISENAPLADRVFAVLQKAQINYVLKRSLQEILTDSTKSIHSRIVKMHREAMTGQNMRELCSALREQLILTEEEF